MFPGSFRAKLNSRSRRRASVFATAVVALHPSFLSPYPLLTYAYSVKYDDWLKSEELDLSCLCVVRQAVLSAFLQLDGTLQQHAFGSCRGVGSIQDTDCIRASLS